MEYVETPVDHDHRDVVMVSIQPPKKHGWIEDAAAAAAKGNRSFSANNICPCLWHASVGGPPLARWHTWCRRLRVFDDCPHSVAAGVDFFRHAFYIIERFEIALIHCEADATTHWVVFHPPYTLDNLDFFDDLLIYLHPSLIKKNCAVKICLGIFPNPVLE